MHDHDVEPLRRRLVRRLLQHLPGEGAHASAVPGLQWLRQDRSSPATPVLQQPTLACMLQGLKRAHLEREVIAYRPGECLVVALPMQFRCDTVVEPGAPMLAAMVAVDLDVVAELVAVLPPRPDAARAMRRGMAVAALPPAAWPVLERLLDAHEQPADARVLGPGLVRELHYRLLQSAAGDGLRALLAAAGSLGRVRRAIARLDADPTAALPVAALAREAAMSSSAFHQAFKAVTGLSPLQYRKQLRLHHARSLMQERGHGAAQAGYAVGYASASQFSRDFRRLFGHPPGVAARGGAADASGSPRPGPSP